MYYLFVFNEFRKQRKIWPCGQKRTDHSCVTKKPIETMSLLNFPHGYVSVMYNFFVFNEPFVSKERFGLVAKKGLIVFQLHALFVTKAY